MYDIEKQQQVIIINDGFLKEANFIFLDGYIILESVHTPGLFCQVAALWSVDSLQLFQGSFHPFFS